MSRWSKWPILAGGAAAGVAALGLIAFGDSSLTRLRRAGAVRIGYAVEAPYAFVGADGEVTGESPEIARRMVARLGLGRIEWRQFEFGSLLAELEAGSIDVIAAGMFVTPERAARVRFSQPTFRVHEALLVAAGNPRGLRSFEDAARRPEVRIAMLAGSVEKARFEAWAVPSHRMVVVPDALAGRVAVETGLVDALALSSPTIRWMAMRAQLGRAEMVEPADEGPSAETSPMGTGAFAFRKDDRRLQLAWDEALKGYLGSAAHRELVARFGFTEVELPQPVAAAEAARL